MPPLWDQKDGKAYLDRLIANIERVASLGRQVERVDHLDVDLQPIRKVPKHALSGCISLSNDFPDRLLGVYMPIRDATAGTHTYNRYRRHDRRDRRDQRARLRNLRNRGIVPASEAWLREAACLLPEECLRQAATIKRARDRDDEVGTASIAIRDVLQIRDEFWDRAPLTSHGRVDQRLWNQETEAFGQIVRAHIRMHKIIS